MYFKDKLQDAVILFQGSIYPSGRWPEKSRSHIELTVTNNTAVVIARAIVVWRYGQKYKDVRCIRVSDLWNVEENGHPESFEHVFYFNNIHPRSAPKSNTQGINTKVSKTNPLKVFNQPEAIVIKGAEPGAKIKVYNTSGVELKSVISNNDVVKIKLPAKQMYSVYVGNTQYKVTLCVP